MPALLSDSQRSIEADLKDYDQTFPIVDAVRKELSLDFWNFNYSAFFVVIAPLGLKKPEISFKNSEIKVKIGSSTNIDPGDIRIRGFGKTGNDNTNLRVAENNFRRDDSNLVYRKAVVVTQEDGAIVDLYYKEDRFENYYVKRIED